MEDPLVSFETAKLAKEKGFDWGVLYSFYKMTFEDTWKPNVIIDYEIKNWNFDNYISRPTQSLLQKWLREVHNIQISVKSCTKNMKGQYVDWDCCVNTNQIIDHRDGKDTYEEALEVGLLEALKLI